MFASSRFYKPTTTFSSKSQGSECVCVRGMRSKKKPISPHAGVGSRQREGNGVNDIKVLFELSVYYHQSKHFCSYL